MHIHIDRVGEPYHFLARNERGNTVEMDASAKAGGTEKGASPMELLVMGLGGCSGIDVVSILEKARQTVTSFAVELEAERAEGQTPSVFTKMHVHYMLEGELEPDRVRRAIDLSLEKYCSVSAMLEKTAAITYSFSVNGTRYDGETTALPGREG